MAKKIAIVAVHGVIPQQRYGFQDQVATALRDQLNGSAVPGAKPAAQAPADSTRRGAGADGRSDYRSGEHGRWRMDIVFPPIAAKPGDIPDPVAAGRPSIVRVHQSEHDVQHPVDDVYDVIEAYWSPIDKGKTNALKVLQWLLATIFQPANTTAHYRGWPIKALSDLAYGLSLGAIALICLAVALVNATNALDLVHGIALDLPASAPPSIWAPFGAAGALLALWAQRAIDIAHWGNPLDWIVHFFVWMRDGISNAWAHVNDLSNPSALLTLLGAPVLVRLAIGAVGAYLGAQGIRAASSFWTQRRELAHVRVQMRSRIAFIVMLFALSGLGLAICACWPLPATGSTGGNLQLGGAAVLLVIAALAFEAFRGILATFLAQFYGDVQIYCTHDENAEFFALRAQILDLVEKRIVDTIKAKYDRVYVFAHSLGSTISLDALMSIYNLRYENGIAEEDWRRIRGFVTFGTALEKTRYFTNVYGASFSASLEEWRDDYYGALFTADASVLDHPNEMAQGIYWANYWFFWDFISDRIASYRSFMKPNEPVSASSAVRAMVRDCLKGKDRAAIPKIVAQNRVSYRFPFWPFEILHGDYLTSSWFWLDDSESSKWWAPAWLGFRPADDRDQAIGALELVTKRDAAVHAAAFAALPVAPPSRPGGGADTALPAESRFDGVPLGQAAATNLVDVLPPA